MAKASLTSLNQSNTGNANPEDSVLDSEPSAETALVPRQAQPLEQAKPAVDFEAISGGALQGEFDSDDMTNPQIRIVSGSSKLKQSFAEGTVVINEDELIPPPPVQRKGQESTPPPTFRFVPISIVKKFRQNLTQEEIDNEQLPQIVGSKEEAMMIDPNATFKWINKVKPSWSPLGIVTMLIEEPEGNGSPEFCVDIEGEDSRFCVAQYYAGGGAYRLAVKNISNTATRALYVPVLGADGKVERDSQGVPIRKMCLHRNYWTFHVQLVPSGQYMVFQPKVLLCREETSPEVRLHCERVLSTE